jgi:integrase
LSRTLRSPILSYLSRDAKTALEKSNNRSPHKIAETLGLIQDRGAHVLFLPPYSPDLNPIEKMWSKLKEFLRSAEARTQPSLIQAIAPEQLEAFLRAVDPDFVPFFALSAFSGLRREEIIRLDWSEVKLDRNLIDLPFSKSKNRRRKLIEIPANLVSWLSPFVQEADR